MITKTFHDKVVYSRRMSRLTELLTPLLADSKSVLDVGCGDGKIDSLLLNKSKEKFDIKGIDVLVRPDTYIEVIEYDGSHIPYEDGSFDTVMAIDVLHHTDDPGVVLAEMVRVAKSTVIIKDHVKSGLISYCKLRAMDYVGNAHYHVRLPYNYLTKRQWNDYVKKFELKVAIEKTDLNLYTGIFHILFDRKLHIIMKLEKMG